MALSVDIPLLIGQNAGGTRHAHGRENAVACWLNVPRITYDDFRNACLCWCHGHGETRSSWRRSGSAAFETAVDNLFTASEAAINPFLIAILLRAI